MTSRFTKSRCPKCRQEVYVGFLPEDQRGSRGRRFMSLAARPLPGAVICPPGPDTQEAWTPTGELVHVRVDFDGGERELESPVYLDHHVGCPVERRRAQASPAPASRVHAPEAIPGDVAACSTCGASVIWIQTAKGRRAPVDPVGRVGYLLSREEATAMKGDRRLVRGFRSSGDVAAICEASPADPATEGREFTTVHVSHFATCTDGNALAGRVGA